MDFFSWMMNPAMLAAGAAAVSLPIIIHLLNRRRFKTVEWAAMDFLLEADKKNRRRVQLENLLLLLLRCAAILLLGLLLARPFMPGMLASMLQQKQKVERIVLLDDSLSQRVIRDGQSSFEAARESLLKLLERSGQAADSDNWLTMYVTSQPSQPLISMEPVTVNTIPNLVDRIRALECTEQAASYSESLAELVRYCSGLREGMGRAVYLFTDLRKTDWAPAEGLVDAGSIRSSLEEIARLANQQIVVDTAGGGDGNLAIVEVRSPDLQVANRVIRIDVKVANYGGSVVNDIPVTIAFDGGPPMREVIPSIAPGQTEIVSFRKLFESVDQIRVGTSPADGRPGPSGIRNHRVVAALERTEMGEAGLKNDLLVDDSQNSMAVRLLDGIPVLLVDGDPSPFPERSETHYLSSLDVFGTGLKMDVITASELENISLSKYRIIFLCNIDEVTEDRVATIESWVQDGGAVVLMPGNQVRSEVFNQTFFRNGEGLSPVALDRIEGDPSMATWVSFEPDPKIHPALRTIMGSDAAGLTRVDVFSWWRTLSMPERASAESTTAIRLSDTANSPAMIDRSWGTGRVIFFNIPGDGDWTMWPAISGAWVPVMLDLIDYLAGNVSVDSEMRIGDSISLPVDLSIYSSRVALRDPGGEKTEVIARSADESGTGILVPATFEPVSRSGFYEVELQRNDGIIESLLYVAKLPEQESRLVRLNVDDARSTLFGDEYTFVEPETLVKDEIKGASSEIWPQVIWVLLGILALEQFLAWWFARRREMPLKGDVR